MPTMSWFRYDGPGTITDPTAYVIIGSTSCENGNKICAINAEVQTLGGVSRPIISPAFGAVITNAQNTATPTSNVKLKV